MDKLTAMRTFAAVARAGSFSAAARGLGLPKTRVSQRVQELEAALSTRLLQRTTRVVALTEEGRAYLDRVEAILADVDAAEAALGSEAARGRLRVSCNSAVARGLILPRLSSFLAAHPGVDVALSVGDRLVNLAEEGFDCAIRGGEMESSSLISRPLGLVTFGLYAARDPWGKEAHPEALAGQGLVKVTAAREGGLRHWSLQRGSETWVESSAPRVETDDDHAAMLAAIGGAGIALCPDFAAAPHVATGALVRLLPDWSGAPRPLHVVYPSRRHPAPRLRVFLDWLGTICPQGPGKAIPKAAGIG